MKIETEIAKIIEANGAYLYDIETLQEFDETIYRILITKAGGVSLDLCASISYELSPFLDVHPPMHHRYRLEVSSPGIERKLTKLVHFQNAIGEKIKLKIVGNSKLKGTLKDVTSAGIVLDIKGEEESFNYSDIKSAKTYFAWN